MDLITLIVAVFLGSGAPILYTFAVPSQEHCEPAAVQGYITRFILPEIPTNQGLQKRFRSMCMVTEAVEPSNDLVLPQQPEATQEPAEPLSKPQRDAFNRHDLY